MVEFVLQPARSVVARLRMPGSVLRSASLLRMLILVTLALGAFGTASAARADTRSLKLYYTHTGEKAEIVFKRNGRYDRAGLKKLNYFLRDWRRNEPTEMDPRLFDLIWEVYRRTGSNNYIHVISAYRSPKTNEMLRRTRGGQAKKSQHILGKAMDFYIPGVKISKLREIGMKVQGGGVGYYPKSGSPFVHLDVGSVRAWPRMSRQELVRLFPDGETLHLPPDGKPLPGYKTALAEYKARGGAIKSSAGGNSGGGGNLLAALFGGGGDEDEGEDTPRAAARPAAAPAGAPSMPTTQLAALPNAADAPVPSEPVGLFPDLPTTAPVPSARPTLTASAAPLAGAVEGTKTALVAPQANLPAQEQVNAFAAAAAAAPDDPASEVPQAVTELASLDVPVPELLAERASGLAIAAAAAAPDGAVPEDTAGTEVAALDPAALAPANDGFIPLPIRRPGDRPSDDFLDAGAPEAEPADPAPETGPTVEMAALVPPPTALDGGRLASAFATGPAPRKGARPSAEDAERGQVSTRVAEPKLSEKMISAWALKRSRVAGNVDPEARAERFVASQLRAAPKEVFAAGFDPDGTALPHDRFTGSAVNFIRVARFGS